MAAPARDGTPPELFLKILQRADELLYSESLGGGGMMRQFFQVVNRFF